MANTHVKLSTYGKSQAIYITVFSKCLLHFLLFSQKQYKFAVEPPFGPGFYGCVAQNMVERDYQVFAVKRVINGSSQNRFLQRSTNCRSSVSICCFTSAATINRLDSTVKVSDPGHFLKSQGKIVLSFPCTLFLHIFDT